ncbi:ATP-binding protein [Candidatus Accumulibacter sp. ACC005]|uniref:AAA family ATPase n=1 Tax=Candidatus Accumulibacter sp. ACC005 TaxID=2823331 RepID=UPI0025C1C1FB|nr:ATP-binding protein [Candidatus Accumulibacter sp. ACC005]
MLKHLQLTNIGPADTKLDFADRLNLITGDNGLGKSFLLDIAWWAMTRKWPGELNSRLTSGRVALPTDKKKKAEIDFSFTGVVKTKKHVSTFEPRLQNWSIPPGRPANPGLVFYAMADGSFAVWDPARNYWRTKAEEALDRPPAYVFSPKEVWDGLQRDDGTWLCNGLIRDWAGWQKEKGRAFESLAAVLAALSPSTAEILLPGALTRISLNDVRDMPTLKMPYGQEVAVVHASSGMRRVISLAYFLVWCWEEHLKAKELMGEEPESKTTFLIDEVESHLHPRWQRTVIPTLLQVMSQLTASAQVQLIAVTHSPLVMASVEPMFDEQHDAWWDLDLLRPHENDVATVAFSRRPFVRLGDVSRWLVSEAFDLGSARSLEAEKVLQQAALILSEKEIDHAKATTLDASLRKLLGDTDPFWIRWRYVGEKQGWLQ